METSAPTLQYAPELTNKPFFSLTRRMLDDVRDHNFEDLSQVCDDDFGIVDINTSGGSQVIRNREEWENWFKGLFKQLKSMNAETWSEITKYEAVEGVDMGYSVVDFDQVFVVNGERQVFQVLATIVWKKVGGVWKEARYHSSLLGMKEI